VSVWRRFWRGLYTLFHRSADDRDIADEVEHYLDEATAAHLARGLPAEEARRAARMELGGVTRLREQVRGYGWENGVETLFADLRHGAHRLRAERGFTTVAVLTLALGLGGTTAVFSVVNPILFEPLPYPDAGRITMLREMGADGSPVDGTFGMYLEQATRARSFGGIAVFKPWQPTLTGRDRPERWSAGQCELVPGTGGVADSRTSLSRVGGPARRAERGGAQRRVVAPALRR
jgi:hypothetical protein